ncbi:expressed unknown protein [Seminavis robusta]|uniref:Uncharacterized protein n=1 Tax=Seminavis robusta TaxID=568900 RepID=A0A9N8D5K7_9STRA|nr:expressed unknown protein [Seminavis robusta]|eukprot:Sro10_g007880.1 n/a (224) ;mRNA; r:33219-33890
MKFLKLFVSKKKNEHHEKESSCVATVTSGDFSQSASSSKKNKKRNKKRNGRETQNTSSIPQEVEEFKTANEKVVSGLLAALNQHGRAEEMEKFFKSGDVRVKFEDAPSITSDIWVAVARQMMQSFPNLHFQYESIKEERSGVVLVEELQASGTHTAEPYAFAHFPPIPTCHKHIVNDPERLWLRVKDGKITDMECVSLGDLTGPAGFYVQCGGKMDMPPPSED